MNRTHETAMLIVFVCAAPAILQHNSTAKRPADIQYPAVKMPLNVFGAAAKIPRRRPVTSAARPTARAETRGARRSDAESDRASRKCMVSAGDKNCSQLT